MSGELMDLRALLENCRERQRRMYRVGPEDMTGHERAGYMRDMVLALHSEADECLRTVYWKPWAKRDVGEYAVPVPARAAEVVDVMLFTMNIALAMGLTADDLAAALDAKVPLVEARFKDETYRG